MNYQLRQLLRRRWAELNQAMRGAEDREAEAKQKWADPQTAESLLFYHKQEKLNLQEFHAALTEITLAEGLTDYNRQQARLYAEQIPHASSEGRVTT